MLAEHTDDVLRDWLDQGEEMVAPLKTEDVAK